MKINPVNLDRRDSYKLMVSAMVPRPIAWVSTVSKEGIFNLAPFSTVSSISLRPITVCFTVVLHRDGRKKDTLRNIEFSKDFVINVVTEPLAIAMNQTSAPYPPTISEFKEAGLTPVKADIVKSPLVAESPVNMECKLLRILHFGKGVDTASFIIGQVAMVHIKDDLWVNGEIPISKLNPIGRLGGDLHCKMTDIFEIPGPEGSHE